MCHKLWQELMGLLSQFLIQNKAFTGEVDDICKNLEETSRIIEPCSKYSDEKEDSTTKHKYIIWNQAAVSNGQLKPKDLPPTEQAIDFHSLPVYLEVSYAKKLDIKGCVRYILLACFKSLKDSTGETSKNVFYFASKALFVLEKIKF